MLRALLTVAGRLWMVVIMTAKMEGGIVMGRNRHHHGPSEGKAARSITQIVQRPERREPRRSGEDNRVMAPIWTETGMGLGVSSG